MAFDTFKEELAKGVQERLEALYDRKYSVETRTVEKIFDMIVRQVSSFAAEALDNRPGFDLNAIQDYSVMKR